MAFFDKTQIISMSAHVFKRSRGVPDKRLMHPRREWGIGLLIFGVTLIVGSGMTAVSFGDFRSIDTNNGEANVKIPKYNGALIGGVIEEYEQRQAAYNALIADRALIPIESETETTSTTTSEVEIISVFSEKLVYTDNMDVAVDPLIAHCEAAGGTFNECGSVCSPTAEVCTEQCAYTCDLSQ